MGAAAPPHTPGFAFIASLQKGFPNLLSQGFLFRLILSQRHLKVSSEEISNNSSEIFMGP